MTQNAGAERLRRSFFNLQDCGAQLRSSVFGLPSSVLGLRFLEELRRDLIPRPFAVPVDRHHPPARAVVEQLDAVDPARERFRVASHMPRLVRAERLRDVAVGLRGPRDLFLEEPGLLEARTCGRRVLVGTHRADARLAVLSCAGRDQPRARDEQRAEAVPIALLARGPRNHVVERGEDRVLRRDVLRTGHCGGRCRSRRSRDRRTPLGAVRVRDEEHFPAVGTLAQEELGDAAVVDRGLSPSHQREIGPERRELSVDEHLRVLDLLVVARARALADTLDERVHCGWVADPRGAAGGAEHRARRDRRAHQRGVARAHSVEEALDHGDDRALFGLRWRWRLRMSGHAEDDRGERRRDGREAADGYRHSVLRFYFLFRAVVAYAASGSASPLGQSSSFPAKSGRACDSRKPAMSNAVCASTVPGRSNGMFRRMNAAATRIRAMPAPMLNDCGPHSGAPEVAATVVTSPSPFTPWQRAQVRRYAVLPLAVSGGSGPMESTPAPASRRPAAEALESHDMYATMSRMSSPSNASGVPFRLRRKQSLMRFSIRPTFPERDRYCGKRPYTPAHGIAKARVPSSRWHDTQRRPLSTLRGRESRVACRSARPRRTDCENGSFRSVESAGAVMCTTWFATMRAAGTGFAPPHAAANGTTAISAGLVMKRLSLREATYLGRCRRLGNGGIVIASSQSPGAGRSQAIRHGVSNPSRCAASRRRSSNVTKAPAGGAPAHSSAAASCSASPARSGCSRSRRNGCSRTPSPGCTSNQLDRSASSSARASCSCFRVR